MSEKVSYKSKLVGVTFEGRQDVIARMTGDEELRARREPDNKFDKNAVAVDALLNDSDLYSPDNDEGDIRYDWQPIGYIAKDKNKDISAALDEGNEVSISIASITGGDGKSFGVNISLSYEKVQLVIEGPAIQQTAAPQPSSVELLEKVLAATFNNDMDVQIRAVRRNTKRYSSRLLGRSAEVSVGTGGHISLPGYLSGSKFPDKFYPEFEEDEILQKIIDKHWGGESDEHKANMKSAILSMWNLNREASVGYGSAIHAALENYDTYHTLGDKIKKVEVLKTKTKVGPNKALSKNPFIKKIVEDFHEKFGGDYTRLSEQFIWLDEKKLAGSIDRVKVIDADKKIVRIQDFKTDGDIHEKKYQNTDSPFYKLTQGKMPKMGKELLDLHWLQLSFYAYILKEYGYTVEGLDVYWLNPEKLAKGENAWEEFSHDVIDIERGL